VGGIADLDAHLLRMIGDPDVRLREDPIRILRAIRLAGRLGFAIDPKTLSAIKRHKGDVRLAAPPRVLEDMLRMFRKGGAERAMSLMHELGVDEIVLAELLAAARPGDLDFVLKALHSLDLATERGTEFSNATLLALVYYPFLRRVLDDADPDSANAGYDAIDKIVGGFEQRLIVPKRDRDRIRQILLAQKRFLPIQRGKRFSSASFIRKPFFPEAFDLFDIITSATGEHREEVRRWKGRISSVAADTDGESLGPEIRPATMRPEDRGRRRRRRGGRGRQEGGRAHESGGVRAEAGGERHRVFPEPEPFEIPDLAPGENPYGDAITVPIPSSSGRQAAGAGQGRSRGSGAHQTHAGAGSATGGPPPAGAARKRRRRRGARKRKPDGGSGSDSGGAHQGEL
jgi:poly(A) polymerase